MAQEYKILGQSAPGAASLQTLYVVPGVTQAVVSSIVVCNRSNVGTSFRVAVAPNGAADSSAHYLCYDVPIAGNDTYTLTAGITLGDADVLRVYATLATLTFQAFGSEIQ